MPSGMGVLCQISGCCTGASCQFSAFLFFPFTLFAFKSLFFPKFSLPFFSPFLFLLVKPLLLFFPSLVLFLSLLFFSSFFQIFKFVSHFVLIFFTFFSLFFEPHTCLHYAQLYKDSTYDKLEGRGSWRKIYSASFLLGSSNMGFSLYPFT